MKTIGSPNAYISALNDEKSYLSAHPHGAARVGNDLQRKHKEHSAAIGDAYQDRFGKSLDETSAKLKRRLDYQVMAVGVVSVGGLGALGGAGATAVIDHKRISKLEASHKLTLNMTQNCETE